MKINRNVDKLKIITKSVINVIFSTIMTMFDNVMMRLVQYWSIKSFMICHKSRSFNSLQHLHFIKIGFTVQCKDLYKWRFPCLLRFPFSSLFNCPILPLYIPALQHNQKKNHLYKYQNRHFQNYYQYLFLWKDFHFYQRSPLEAVSVSLVCKRFAGMTSPIFLRDFRNCWLWLTCKLLQYLVMPLFLSKSCYFGLNSPLTKK